MTPRKASSKLEPQIVEMPPQKVATVTTLGDPNTAGRPAMSALYGSVYTLKFDLKKKGVDFKVGALRARWPDTHLRPKDQWTGVWALPIPEDTESLPKKAPDAVIEIGTWDYGTVAQILHLGPYAEEEPTIKRLLDFIAENDYEIAGPHEEEYLTRPDAKVQKTIIRYQVRKK